MPCKSSLREEMGAMSAEQTEMGSKTLSDVAFAEGRRLADDPNIVAVGHGAKVRQGEAIETGSVVFFVRKKLASPAAIVESGSAMVPPIVGGFPTDVVEVGHLAAARADRADPAGRRGRRIDDPLVGGVATMGLGPSPAGPGGYGTLGGQCFDSVSRAPLVISNAHVWGMTAGTEVVQPIMASAILGAGVTTAAIVTPPGLVQTRIPTGVVPPVVFANSVAQTHLITGASDDPLPAGQGATPVTAATRTDSEQVILSADPVGFAPAGVRLFPTVSWDYQRLSSTAVLQNTTSLPRAATKLLTARRLFTNAASYTGSQPVNLYAEIIPVTGGSPETAVNHLALAVLYPVATGDKFIPRILRPTIRAAVTTASTSFSGFPNPARVTNPVVPVVLPAVAGGFTVDSDQTASFVAPPGGSGLPANTFVLKLPTGTVRLFVPIGTQVVLDIDLAGAPNVTAQAINSARDPIQTTVSPPATGTGTRKLVTISASEIVEVVLTNVTNMLLFGVTSRRASPEASGPLSYAGTISAADLTPKGKWAASLFVQERDSGTPESANVVETAIGAAALISDCTFDVA
jgi:hypothetical protein